MDIFFPDQIVFLVPDDMFDIGALEEITPDFPIAEPLESPDYFRQLFVGTAISGAFSIVWTNSAALYAVDSTFGRGRYPRRPGTNTYGRGRRPRRPAEQFALTGCQPDGINNSLPLKGKVAAYADG